MYRFVEFDSRVIPEYFLGLIEDIIPPPTGHLGYRNGPRVLFRKDKETGEVPPPMLLVDLLGHLKRKAEGKQYDTNLEEAVWTNTNWHVCTLENVTFRPMRSVMKGRQGRPPRVKLDVPPDHPDYPTKYAEHQRAYRREYQKLRNSRLRMAAAALREELGSVTGDVSLATSPVMIRAFQSLGDDAAPMQKKLEEILENVAKTETPRFKKEEPDVTWGEVSKAEESEEDKYITELLKMPDPYVKE